MDNNLSVRKSWLSLRQQRRWVAKWFPAFSCIIKRGVLLVRGQAQPTALSENYDFKIEYRLGCHPISQIERPNLVCPAGQDFIPHLNPDGSLCLYYPAKKEWTPRHKLTHTIIPWISMWLFYYECWRFTGQRGSWGPHPATIPEPLGFDPTILLRRSVVRAAEFKTMELKFIG